MVVEQMAGSLKSSHLNGFVDAVAEQRPPRTNDVSGTGLRFSPSREAAQPPAAHTNAGRWKSSRSVASSQWLCSIRSRLAGFLRSREFAIHEKLGFDQDTGQILFLKISDR